MPMQSEVVVPVKTLRTDIFNKSKLMNSPTCSAKKIRADLNKTGISVSRQTIIRRLVKEFDLRSRKPARKPRLTLKMKKKRFQFALQHKDWTCAQWFSCAQWTCAQWFR